MVDQDLNKDRSLVPHFLAGRLRVVLARKQMTQRQLSEQTGIPQPTLATYLAGRVAMPVTALHRIAAATGVDPGWLLRGAEQVLDVRGLTYAAMKALLKENMPDSRGANWEEALAKAVKNIAAQYGASCDFAWSTGEYDPSPNPTFTMDFEPPPPE